MSLPVQQSRFIGRVDELQIAGELLHAHRLYPLGAGGSGKTRLAIQVALEAASGFRTASTGCHWRPFETLISWSRRSPRSSEPTACSPSTLRSKPSPGAGQRRAGCGCSGAFARVVARRVPSVHFLVTSESRCASRGTAFHGAAAQFQRCRALFVERARAVDPTFVEEATVEAICGRLDRLPLAVELAATWVNVLPLSALLTRLERRLPMLLVGRVTCPRVIRRSEQRLNGVRTCCRRGNANCLSTRDILSQLRSQGAEEVCAADLETISALVDKSLVHRGRDDRFALLETVQEFAAERLTAVERDELARRHGAYFTQAAEAMAGMQSWPSNPRLSENSTRTWQTYALPSPGRRRRATQTFACVSGSPCPGSGSTEAIATTRVRAGVGSARRRVGQHFAARGCTGSGGSPRLFRGDRH